jgi:transcriptional regulator NrdR family protein
MISAGESLFDGHKDKSALMSSIKGLQLSRQTVARRVEQISDNLESQMHQDLQSC